MRRVRVLAAGRVQGVGFRYTMREAAQRAAVTGWVRNRIDGSVEAEIEGTPERVDELLTWTSHGPPWAKVESVTVTEIHPVADTGFEIRGAGG